MGCLIWGYTVTGWLRWSWGQLTSMRNALVLLLLLALAAIPGSLLPQSRISAIDVASYKREHPELDKIWQPLGMYDVYGSAWFSAIYLLLFISLIGCIFPRIVKYAKDLRRPPTKLPKRVDRLAATAIAEVKPDDQVLDLAENWLKKKRYRVLRTPAGLSAERGYLREAGNLTFHMSLVAVLVGLAWSNLAGFSGTVVVVEGRGFANSITQYDDFTHGSWVNTDALEPFSIEVKRFRAEFETGQVQRGAARLFEADIAVTQDQPAQTDEMTMTVNQPFITHDGTQINLLGHGYAPHFTVRDGNGDIAFDGPVVFLPQDGNFSSVGVIKVPDARPERLAFEGIFLPTAVHDENGPRSVFPDALEPAVWLNAWRGKPAEETGVPESVYTLNTAGLEPVLAQDGQRVRAGIKPGTGFTLPDGLGSIQFDGYSRWVKLQMSQTPGNLLALWSIMVGIVGLTVSLMVKPRRLFVVLREEDVLVGGLDKSQTALRLDDEVAALAEALQQEEKK